MFQNQLILTLDDVYELQDNSEEHQLKNNSKTRRSCHRDYRGFHRTTGDFMGLHGVTQSMTQINYRLIQKT